MFSLSRVAMAIVNFTCQKEKVIDGFGRLLTRTDISQFKSKKGLPLLESLDLCPGVAPLL